LVLKNDRKSVWVPVILTVKTACHLA
jgi:hypothetical protein